jgi:hypothetical protein
VQQYLECKIMLWINNSQIITNDKQLFEYEHEHE